jgi:hypothetical protein
MKAKVRKTLNLLLQVLIILAAYGFLYRELFQKRDISESGRLIAERITDRDFIFYLLAALLLMLLNWSVEAVKWRFLISKYEPVPFHRALKAVFSGVTVSVFTPNRIGEYFGRVFILKHLHPLKGVLITFMGSMGQLMATVIAGAFGMIFFLPNLIDVYVFPSYLFYWGIVLTTLIMLVVMIILYLNFSVVSELIKKILPWGREKLEKYIGVFDSYKSGELAHVLLLSLARYGVFTTQFIILLLAFGIHLPVIHYLIIIPVIFLLITIIPSIALSELGIRGSLSLYLFGFYVNTSGEMGDESAAGILAASFLLWFINLAIPALTGTVFIFNLRFFSGSKNHSG